MLSTDIIALLMCGLVCVSGGISPKKTISISVKDTHIQGLESLNAEWVCPFEIEDYIVGFKNSGGVTNSLFAKRSFILPDENGELSLSSSFNLIQKIAGFSGEWKSDKFGVCFKAHGDSKDAVTGLEMHATQPLGSNILDLDGKFNPINNKFSTSARFSIDNAYAELSYDNIHNNALLTLSHNLDPYNTVTPSFNLQTGHTKVNYLRKWRSGSLNALYIPSDKIEISWTDISTVNEESNGGSWTTHAEIPLHDTKKGTKLSFSRSWQY